MIPVRSFYDIDSNRMLPTPYSPKRNLWLRVATVFVQYLLLALPLTTP